VAGRQNRQLSTTLATLNRHIACRYKTVKSIMKSHNTLDQWCGLRPSILGQNRSETQKISLGLPHCGRPRLIFCKQDQNQGLGFGLACLVLCCETRCYHARRHNDLEGHNNFASTIYSFSILCLEHHYRGHQQWRSLTYKLNPPSVPLFTSGSLGLVSSGLGLVILVLVLILRIWSCLHHCFRSCNVTI